MPKRVELTFISSNEQYAIEKFHNDYIMYDVLNPEKRVIIQKEFTKDITIEEISSSVKENGISSVTYAISIPTGFESKSSILLTGEINAQGDNFIGQIRRSDSSVIEDINIKAFKNDGNIRAYIIIVVGGLALGAISCAIANMIANCGSECKDTCGSAGVESYEELYCGRCKCQCKE